MAELDAGVDVRDGDSLAGDPFGPGLVGADLLDAPLRVADDGLDDRARLDRLHERIDLLGVD